MGFEWADDLVEPSAPLRARHLGCDGVVELDVHPVAPASQGRIKVTVTAVYRIDYGDIIDFGTVEVPGLPPIDLGAQVVEANLFPGDTLAFEVSLMPGSG